MKRFVIGLVALSVVALLQSGCSPGTLAPFAASVELKLPPGPLDQSLLLSFAQSTGFASRVRAHAATNGWGPFELHVMRPDAGMLEFGVYSANTQTAWRVVSLMTSQLQAYAVSHKLGEVRVVTRPATNAP
jgi:hypothetical protein